MHSNWCTVHGNGDTLAVRTPHDTGVWQSQPMTHLASFQEAVHQAYPVADHDQASYPAAVLDPASYQEAVHQACPAADHDQASYPAAVLDPASCQEEALWVNNHKAQTKTHLEPSIDQRARAHLFFLNIISTN